MAFRCRSALRRSNLGCGAVRTTNCGPQNTSASGILSKTNVPAMTDVGVLDASSCWRGSSTMGKGVWRRDWP